MTMAPSLCFKEPSLEFLYKKQRGLPEGGHSEGVREGKLEKGVKQTQQQRGRLRWGCLGMVKVLEGAEVINSAVLGSYPCL